VEIRERVLQFFPDASNRDVEGFFERHFSGLVKSEHEQVPLQDLGTYVKDFEDSILKPLNLYHKRIKEKLISEVNNFLLSSMWVSERLAEYLRRSRLLDWEEYFQLKVSFEEPSEGEEKLIKKLKSYELLERRTLGTRAPTRGVIGSLWIGGNVGQGSEASKRRSVGERF
jgi:ATP-dependent DNA helicase DinG